MVLGSRGWCYPHWTGPFYPNDLPDDWRFSYYCNEFNAVLVPHHYWFDAEAGDPGQWLEDCSDDFEFFCEIDTGGDVSKQLSSVSILSGQISALVLRGNGVPSRKTLAEITAILGREIGLFSDNPNWLITSQSQGCIPEMGGVFIIDGRAEDDNENTTLTSEINTPGCIAMLESSVALSIAELKSHMEKLMKLESGGVCHGLFVDSDNPDIDQLTQASHLYELMA